MSEMQDSNLRPLGPKPSAIPGYANLRIIIVASSGLEPKLTESNSVVLPLHYEAV